jgi:prepilin peptidase CpaA
MHEPLPSLGWAAAFLFFVVEEDLRIRRIPNWLTLPALVVALGLGVWTGGWSGASTPFLGAAIAFAVLFPMFLWRGMGAGDVKALMVLGALWGPIHLLASLWWMLVVGGLIALAVAAVHGVLTDLVRRWALSLWASLVSLRWTYFAPPVKSRAPIGVPFGVAIALGAAAYQYSRLPWS